MAPNESSTDGCHADGYVLFVFVYVYVCMTPKECSTDGDYVICVYDDDDDDDDGDDGYGYDCCLLIEDWLWSVPVHLLKTNSRLRRPLATCHTQMAMSSP